MASDASLADMGGTASGGSVGTGGGVSTGGRTGTGGTVATGGRTGTGGTVATGGGTGKGGGTGTGGGTGKGGSTGAGGTVATGGIVGAGGATSTTGLFLNGFFLIGTYMPTTDEFQKWKDRGVNTLVEEAGAANPSTIIAAWSDKAQKMGLKMIRRPLPNPADDIGNTNLLAWMQEDEPDGNGQGYVNIQPCTAKYNAWKQIDPTRPVYINFGGSDVVSALDGAPPTWCSSPYTDCILASTYASLIAAADWVSNDRYPVTGYLNAGTTRGDLTLIGDPMDKLATWTTKPLFDYIETSSQNFVAGTRGVTPDELRVEIWLSIIHGVRGYVFFPQVVGGNTTNDGTPADVATEMTNVNALVTQIASVLQGAINPPQITATAASPVEVGWRNAPGGMYFIAVNPVTTTQNTTLTLTGTGSATVATVLGESRTVPISGGKITDSFASHEVHIYVVGK
jgi:hypothetical protein